MTETGRWCGELRLRNFKTGAIIPVLMDWFRIDDKRTGEAAVMATVSRDLTAQKQAEAELRSLNNRLDQQIRSRTIALSDANFDLQRAVELQRHADARLQELQSELFHAGRLSAMGQMAGALAHELGQPLGAITNYINAARRFLTEGRDHEPELARMNMDNAAEVVLRAGRIIQRLREFVAGGQPERQPENIADLIEDAGLLALIGTAALDIDVARHIAPKLPLALVDRTQIQQVLVNLIRNAIEAMADSKRRELTLTAARSDRETIGIAVADSGQGIPDDVASRLFQPFVTTKRQNMGLGLSICRSIVEAHGGQLWHEPNTSSGTVFRLRCRQLIGMTMSSEQIVHIVDDDTDFRQSLARLLEAAGYTTTTFASGSAFLTVAPRLSEGCVLLDVQMPRMDGFAVLESFRKQGIRLPVVVMTVHGNVATAVRAMRAGAFEFVEKPFDDTPLLAMIHNALTHPGPFRHESEVAQAIEQIAALSPREHEVLAGLLAGRPNKTIAYDLNISVRTVEVHRARLMDRLGVQTFAEVIRLGVLASLR